MGNAMTCITYVAAQGKFITWDMSKFNTDYSSYKQNSYNSHIVPRETIRYLINSQPQKQHFWTCEHHPSAIDNWGAKLERCAECEFDAAKAKIMGRG